MLFVYFCFIAVSPEIDDLKTSSDVHVNEGDEASLECHAKGHPKPKIKWLREDRGNFTVYDRNNKRMIGNDICNHKNNISNNQGDQMELMKMAKMTENANLMIKIAQNA